MGLGDYLNKLGFFRELIYSSIFAGLITILGCDGCDSGPVSPSNGGNGPDTTVCIGDKGVTKEDGVLILEVKDQRFNVNVVDSFDSPLEDVLVGGHELGDNHYLFLAEDSLGRFAPHAVYENPNQNSSIDGLDDGLNPFDVDIILIPIYEDSSYVRRFKTIPADLPMDKFIPVATTNLTNLGKVYAEERSLFTNTEILEFITEIPGSPGIISFATELNDFRNTFLEEEGYAVRWSYVLNDIARQFGGGFNPDAYYLNVLLHEGSGVLINRTNWEGYCTLKSNVFDENGIPVNNAFIELLGINGGSGYTDLEGRCMLLFLKERLYPIIVSASGFETLNLEDYIYQPLHPNYVCNIIDFILKEPVIRDTLVLHPGPEEGKDAYISDRYPNTNYGGDRDLYMRYHFGGDPDINRSYLYLDISSIPDNAIIRSATLSESKKASDNSFFIR